MVIRGTFGVAVGVGVGVKQPLPQAPPSMNSPGPGGNDGLSQLDSTVLSRQDTEPNLQHPVGAHPEPQVSNAPKDPEHALSGTLSEHVLSTTQQPLVAPAQPFAHVSFGENGLVPHAVCETPSKHDKPPSMRQQPVGIGGVAVAVGVGTVVGAAHPSPQTPPSTNSAGARGGPSVH